MMTLDLTVDYFIRFCLGGSAVYLFYAGLILVYGFIHTKPAPSFATADAGDFVPSDITIQARISLFFSEILSPSVFLGIVNCAARLIRSVTHIKGRPVLTGIAGLQANIRHFSRQMTKLMRRCWQGNEVGAERTEWPYNRINDGHNPIKIVFYFFLFYYFIVSAPAAALLPINYDQKTTLQAIIALLMMMVTNALGDYISVRITLRNMDKISKFFNENEKNLDMRGYTIDFKRSFLLELKFYLITVCDMLLAMVVLLCVLILTSIYFGVAIGEYEFELSMHALNGGFERAISFWSTCMEPYTLRGGNWTDGPPMLFIYSLTSFIPSIFIFFLSIIWIIFLPLRLITFSDMKKSKKVFAAEGIVLLQCVFLIAIISVPDSFHIFS